MEVTTNNPDYEAGDDFQIEVQVTDDGANPLDAVIQRWNFWPWARLRWKTYIIQAFFEPRFKAIRAYHDSRHVIPA